MTTRLRTKPCLRIVPQPEDELKRLIALRAVLVDEMRDVDADIAKQLRLLADKRGVAFIRLESVMQELGR